LARLLIDAPGQAETETVTLDGADRLLIGRLPNASLLPTEPAAGETRCLAVPSPNVSANHALAYLTSSGVRIRDLDSKNGTWVRIPRGATLDVPVASNEVELLLASSLHGVVSDESPQAARYRDGADFGQGVSRAVSAWLSAVDVPARVWVVGEAPTDASAFGLATGEVLCVRAERTVDSTFHDRMVLLSRYVSTQNSLFSAEARTRSDGMILASSAIRNVHRRIVELALQSLPSVVLLGPSGSGKERLAETFHRCLGRGGSMVAVNCATLTRERLVVDLFGAEAGAYTDAKRTMTGAVERADGGTLFLDEIGELPLDVQPMLLRFLETGEYQRLGGIGHARFADVRVVAATNRDLRMMAREGKFREDLFFRLALEIIEVPPLAERAADVRAFLDSQMLGTVAASAACQAEALAMIEAHAWAGNFRELVNFARRLPRNAEAGSLSPAQIRRALEAGSLSSTPPTRSVTPPEPKAPANFIELLSASAAAFGRELNGQPPSNWSDVTTFVESYLKPFALAHLAGLQDVRDLDGITIGSVAELVRADRGTVSKQLRRYFECKKLGD
jgi:DNA-binding NtrC family response regulator